MNLLMKTDIPAYAIHDASRISGFFGEYRFLSNFPDAPVEYLGVRYPSVEVAFQAAKAPNAEARAPFAQMTSVEAKRAAKVFKIILSFEWEAKKTDIMTYLVFQKFSRHAHLREQLLATGTKTLIEANDWRDTYWGVWYVKDSLSDSYTDMGGDNMLGKILTKVRRNLR